MGLDIYVGPLMRYYVGDWLTIVQQAGLVDAIPVEIVRATPSPADAITDPGAVQAMIEQRQQGVLRSLGAGQAWPEDGTLPYWTDKPDWDGYGGLVLLAAYDEQPELRPGQRKRRFGRDHEADDARAFGEALAYQQASKNPVRYPTLLSGVEWWLPLDAGPAVFKAPRPSGEPTRMASVGQLVKELNELAGRIGMTNDAQIDDARQGGPPSTTADVEQAGRFGAAVFIRLARAALQSRQPLLMDY